MINEQPAANNDNQYCYRLFCYTGGEHGDKLALMKHISLAGMLIKKYSPRSYKHSADHPDYQFLEYQLCGMLNLPSSSPVQRTFLLSDLSWLLETTTLKLMEDPLLLFEPTSLARFP